MGILLERLMLAFWDPASALQILKAGGVCFSPQRHLQKLSRKPRMEAVWPPHFWLRLSHGRSGAWGWASGWVGTWSLGSRETGQKKGHGVPLYPRRQVKVWACVSRLTPTVPIRLWPLWVICEVPEEVRWHGKAWRLEGGM